MPQWDPHRLHTRALRHVFSVWYQMWTVLIIKWDMPVDTDYSVTWMILCSFRIALYTHWHTEAEPRGTLFCRQNFQICMSIAVLWFTFTEVCTKLLINDKPLLVQIMTRLPNRRRTPKRRKPSTSTKLQKSIKNMPLLTLFESHFINITWKCCDISWYCEMCQLL